MICKFKVTLNSSSRIVPIFFNLHIDQCTFFLIPDVQNLNFNDYMVRQVNLNIRLSVVQINTHSLKSVLMPLAKGLDLTTMKKKITLFCITIHQHTFLACVSVKDDKDTRGGKHKRSESGNFKNQGQHSNMAVFQDLDHEDSSDAWYNAKSYCVYVGALTAQSICLDILLLKK